jgi:hypothetical protein
VCFVYRMVRWYRIVSKNIAWHAPIPLVPILDSFLESEVESDPGWWAGGVSSDEEVENALAGLEIVIPEMKDSKEDEIQTLKPSHITMMNLVSESEEDSEEIEVLEPPLVPIVDLVSEDEE